MPGQETAFLLVPSFAQARILRSIRTDRQAGVPSSRASSWGARSSRPLPSASSVFSAMVGMARRAVPAREVAGGTNIQATLAFEGVAPLHAARTSQRDLPTTLTRIFHTGVWSLISTAALARWNKEQRPSEPFSFRNTLTDWSRCGAELLFEALPATRRSWAVC